MKQALQLLIKDITINRLIETSATDIDKIYIHSCNAGFEYYIYCNILLFIYNCYAGVNYYIYCDIFYLYL
jgi:hypothetical protein